MKTKLLPFIICLFILEIGFSQPSVWPPDGKILIYEDSLNTAIIGGPKATHDDGAFVFWSYGEFPNILRATTKIDKWGNKVYPNADRLFPLILDDLGNVFGTITAGSKILRKIDSLGVQQWGNGVSFDFGANSTLLRNWFPDNNGGIYTLTQHSFTDSFKVSFQHFYSDGTTQFPQIGKELSNLDSTFKVLQLISFENGAKFYSFELGRKFSINQIDTLGNYLWNSWLAVEDTSISSTAHIFSDWYLYSKINTNNSIQLIVDGYSNFDTVRYFNISSSGSIIDSLTFTPSIAQKCFYHKQYKRLIPTKQGFIVLNKSIASNNDFRLFHITHQGNLTFFSDDSTGHQFQFVDDILASDDSTFWARSGKYVMRFDSNFTPTLSTPTNLTNFTAGFTPTGDLITDGKGGFYILIQKQNKKLFLLHVSKNGLFNEVLKVKDDEELIPSTFENLKTYPNPFNPNTTIEFELEKYSEVQISIFNTLGQKVKVLADGKKFSKGIQKLSWNGRNDEGTLVSSGVYFVRLKTNEEIKTKKILYLK